MRNAINVHKNRTNVKVLKLGYDVSGDTFVSEIRDDDQLSGDLIATWDISFQADGTNGVVLLTLTAADLANVSNTKGFMDIKRISGGEPYPLFDEVLQVIFKDTVTQ